MWCCASHTQSNVQPAEHTTKHAGAGGWPAPCSGMPGMVKEAHHAHVPPIIATTTCQHYNASKFLTQLRDKYKLTLSTEDSSLYDSVSISTCACSDEGISDCCIHQLCKFIPRTCLKSLTSAYSKYVLGWGCCQHVIVRHHSVYMFVLINIEQFKVDEYQQGR